MYILFLLSKNSNKEYLSLFYTSLFQSIRISSLPICDYISKNCNINIIEWDLFFQFSIIISLSPFICILNSIIYFILKLFHRYLLNQMN